MHWCIIAALYLTANVRPQNSALTGLNTFFSSYVRCDIFCNLPLITFSYEMGKDSSKIEENRVLHDWKLLGIPPIVNR